jgi:hypothetical protein
VLPGLMLEEFPVLTPFMTLQVSVWAIFGFPDSVEKFVVTLFCFKKSRSGVYLCILLIGFCFNLRKNLICVKYISKYYLNGLFYYNIHNFCPQLSVKSTSVVLEYYLIHNSCAK